MRRMEWVGQGMKTAIETIDGREDFKTFMNQYGVSWQMSGQRGPRREGPPEDGFVRSSSFPYLRSREINRLINCKKK